MVKEIISVNIGQAGIQISNAAWELFCMEHGIRPDGFSISGFPDISGVSQNTFFNPVNERFVPRCLSVDFEPTVIDEIRLGVYRNLFNPRFMISGFEDASGNFARGCFTEGKRFIKPAIESLRKLIESCSCLQGFCFLNSYDGGTGSGFTSLVEEEISIHFSKITKFQLGLLPSSKLASSTVFPYNSLLHTYYTISFIDMCPLLVNESLYSICSCKLNMDRPSFTNINRIIGQIFSNITVSLRFENYISSSLDQMCTNMIPFPKLHFALVHASPICDQNAYDKSQITIHEITNELFDIENQLVTCDPRDGKFIACFIQYRGDVCPVNVNKAICNIKSRVNIQFVDWCPTGFKIGISNQPPASPPGSCLAHVKRNATMLSNTSSISEIWNNLIEKFDCLYSKRAFIHWFVGEGLEQEEFVEAKNTITQLKMDYIEICQSTQSDTSKKVEENQGNISDYFDGEDLLKYSETTKIYSLNF